MYIIICSNRTQYPLNTYFTLFLFLLGEHPSHHAPTHPTYRPLLGIPTRRNALRITDSAVFVELHDICDRAHLV